MIEPKNNGVIEGYGPTNYWANAVSGVLPYEVRNPSGGYEPYLPSGESQWNESGDSMSCVSFGSTNAIECEEKRQTGKQPNYSDRWLAVMSGTTRKGNYLHIVADTIRKYGLVLESDYPAPKGNWNWSEYHKPIAEPLQSELLAKGKEWLLRWDLRYEWVQVDKASMIKHMKHGPLIVVLPGHLVMNFRTTNDVVRYFDSYAPYKKTTANVLWAMKLVLTPLNEALDKDTLLVDINYLDTGKPVEKLLRVLKRNGWVDLEGHRTVYDEEVAEYVLRFQKANFPDVWWRSMKAWTKPLFWEMVVNWPGHKVGKETRKILNKHL